MDSATVSLKRPSMARAQVEIDLLKERPQKIWIDVEGEDGFWQRIDYENVPEYCQYCWHVGHAGSQCRIHNPELKLENHRLEGSKRTHQVYTPKVVSNMEPVVNQTNDSMHPKTTVLASHPSSPNALVKTAAVTLVSPNADLPRLPVIFCGDDSDDELEEIAEPHQPANVTQPANATQDAILVSKKFPPGIITCGYEPPSSSSILPSHDFPPLSDWMQPRSKELVPHRLNVDATAWHPLNRSNQPISFQHGRQLPMSFGTTSDFNAPDDDFSSWRTMVSAETEEEVADGEDSMEDFLDSQFIRDDLYLEKRKNRQSQRERDIVQQRRGRGRPLGSRNRSYTDMVHHMRTRSKMED